MMYLAEKTGRFWPQDQRGKYEVAQEGPGKIGAIERGQRVRRVNVPATRQPALPTIIR
jgi:hypothetical protein